MTLPRHETPCTETLGQGGQASPGVVSTPQTRSGRQSGRKRALLLWCTVEEVLGDTWCFRRVWELKVAISHIIFFPFYGEWVESWQLSKDQDRPQFIVAHLGSQGRSLDATATTVLNLDHLQGGLLWR